MASNELIRAFEEYKSYYERHGTDEQLINACIEAAKTAFKVEEDQKYGLIITAETKKYINELIYNKTGAGFFDLERYALAHDEEYTIINSGYDVYRLESFSKFESYMLYMERDRWQEKRFYYPRRNTLRIVANDMQRLEDDELDVYGLSMPSRVGKLIADDVPVMTRQGWKNHGDLTIGDEVVGLNGEFVKVTHVFPKNQANVRVHFSDHTYIDCHENHEWLVFDKFLNRERIIETKELRQSIVYSDDGILFRYRLPIRTPQDKGEDLTGIENIESRQGNCISVEDGIYRVGKGLKPTHNSTICVMFLTWVGVRKPDSHNAMGGHSGQLAKRFFRGLDNLIEQPEYKYDEIFRLWNPQFVNVIQSKSSDPAEYTINLGTPDEFSTYTCRGIDGTWTGAVDVSSDGYLYVDDLVRDREHSLSPSRMENTYQEYQNKMLDRMNDGAKKLLVGTLWSVIDPLERERKLNEGNPRALFRKIPALNENDESNFQYKVKGFSTQYYIDMRNRLEKAEWMAKFQQQPFVREGLTFPVEELKFFDGTLPVGSCRTIAHLDVAFGGGDSASMPVCKDFGEVGYIVGWVHDSRSPGFTVPKIVDAIDKYYITLLWIEKNSGGQLYADKIKEEMDRRGIIHCKIELYSAPNRLSKEDKITGHSDFVKRYFRFLSAKSKVIEEDMEVYFADGDYRKAVDEMTTWSAEAKGKVHDDAPDSIASLAMKLDKKKSHTTRIMSSPI